MGFWGQRLSLHVRKLALSLLLIFRWGMRLICCDKIVNAYRGTGVRFKIVVSDAGTRRNTGDLAFPALTSFVSCVLLCSAIFAVMGCSSGQPIDGLFTAASSQLTRAQEAEAAEYAKPEFEEAKDLLAEAYMALENKDKSARNLVEKARVSSRLAEARARQSKAEAEAAQLEADLEKALEEASRVREERQSAESELAARSVNNE